MGSSKKTTVGYKYSLGFDAGLCIGPIDKVFLIRFDERVAWVGESTGGSISIDSPKLYGGDGREGGVVGTFDIDMGGPAQTPNAYLQSKQSSTIPSGRGIARLISNGAYLGNNPYLKPFDVLAQRIHTSTRGTTQWYDAKAEIPNIIGTEIPITSSGWDYQQLPYHSNPGTTNLQIPTSGWNSGGAGPFTDSNLWDRDPDLSIFWIRKTVSVSSIGMKISAAADNGCILFVNGEYIGASNPNNDHIPNNQNFPVEFQAPSAGSYEIVVKAYTEGDSEIQGGNYLSIAVEGFPVSDMNPAHIIRECLTDDNFGLGLSSSDIDDASFTAAADTLYDEQFGLSFLWSQDSEIQDFIVNVLRHINASLYVDNKTGKFVLKLIRDDYTVGSLLSLDESNIVSIEEYKKPALRDLTNYVTVKYYDITTLQDASLSLQDTSLFQQQGSITDATVSFEGISNADLASKVAARTLKELSTPLLTATIIANREAGSLNIGDAFKFSWPKYGLSETVMRVTATDYGTLQNGKVRIECVQDVFGFPDAVYATPSDSEFTSPQNNPTDPTDVVVQEANYYTLIQNQGEEFVLNPLDGYLLTGVGSPSSDSINYRIWTDETGDYVEKEPADFCPVATLTSNMPKVSAGSIVTNVNISGLSADDVADIDIGSIVQINDEYMEVVSVTATTLEVERAVVDTLIADHSIGDKVYFWGDSFYGVSEDLYQDGESINVKLTPETPEGQLDVNQATAYSLTFDQRAYRPYPPADIQYNGQYFPESIEGEGPLEITWADRDRTIQTASLIGFTDGSIGPESGVTYTIDIVRSDTGETIETSTGESGNSYTMSSGFEGQVSVSIKSVRSGLDSYYTQSFTTITSRTFIIAHESEDLITLEDGSGYLLTES